MITKKKKAHFWYLKCLGAHSTLKHPHATFLTSRDSLYQLPLIFENIISLWKFVFLVHPGCDDVCLKCSGYCFMPVNPQEKRSFHQINFVILETDMFCQSIECFCVWLLCSCVKWSLKWYEFWENSIACFPYNDITFIYLYTKLT